jgi:hypothetical protein
MNAKIHMDQIVTGSLGGGSSCSSPPIASPIYSASFWPDVTAEVGAAKYEIVKIPSGAWLGYAISKPWK